MIKFYLIAFVTVVSFLFVGCSKDTAEEITFFVGADNHFGVTDSSRFINESIAELMNRLPGTRYPDSLSGDVAEPQWVSFVGDLTDHGTAEEWGEFVEVFGLNGGKQLQYPVHEGFGNHDGPIHGQVSSPVRRGIKLRNQKREGVLFQSKDSLHYSWDSGAIHFVNLNSYPGSSWDPECEWCPYFKDGFREPAHSLEFLESDLMNNVRDSTQPVVLFFHYGFDEWGNKWWTSEEQEQFYQVIQEYNVIAIFHGHTHTLDHYFWKDIPVWCVGAVQKSPDIGNFLVVRIGDNQLSVAERDETGWGRVYFSRF